MARTIVVTSGKGGVGKTTLTATLGRMLGVCGCRVLLIDADAGLNNLDVVMNMENRIVFDITDVLAGRCRLHQALLQDEIPTVFMLPSFHGYDESEFSGEDLRRLTCDLSEYDYCLVDCPAGIEKGFHRAVSACGEAIVVTTPHISALKDAEKVISILRNYGRSPYLVLNRVRGDLVLNSDMVSADEVKKVMDAPLLGVIPENDAVGVFSNTGKLLPRSNEGYKAFMMLARNFINGTDDLYDATKKYRGILGGIKRAVRRNG